MDEQPKEDTKQEAYQESTTGDALFSGVVEIRDLPIGTTIKLRNGARAEVTANPGDGGWLFIRYLEHEDPAKVGEDDMVFCVDVGGVA